MKHSRKRFAAFLIDDDNRPLSCIGDKEGIPVLAVGGDTGAQVIAELCIPKPCLIQCAQRVNFLSVGQSQREIRQMTFEIERFITNDVSIRQKQVEHFAIVKTVMETSSGT